MDSKLAEYRARKRRDEFIKSTKRKLASLFLRGGCEMKEDALIKDEIVEVQGDDEVSISSGGPSECEDEIQCCDELTYAKFSVYASLWLILFSLAIFMEFGAVYFVVSMLYIIWANTRTGPKQRGEVSAYSVFNPNCEAIDGTIKPEQFEKELRYGAL